MKYLIYTRVSPKGSSFEGETSVGMQEQTCREYIARVKGEVSGVIVDDLISGKDTNRPGLNEIMAQLDAGSAQWETLCVYRMDRLTRSSLDQLLIFKKFVDCNKGIVSATEPYFDYSTPIGRMQLAQIAAVNQYQREVNAENTRNKMISIAAGGGCPFGKPPLGYKRAERKNNVLQIDPRNAAIVREIFRMYLSPALQTHDICKKFKMNIQQVMNILHNKIYLGKIVYAGREFPGRHEPIIDMELFAAVQARLPEKRLHSRPKSSIYPYLLTGLVKCHCGRFMTPGSAKNSQYHYYRCTDAVSCKNAIAAPVLENKILESLTGQRFSENAKKSLKAEVDRRRLAYLQRKTPEIESLERARIEAENERDRLYHLILDLRGSEARFLNERLEKLCAETEMIENQISEYHHVNCSNSGIYQQIDDIIDQILSFADLLRLHPDDKNIQRQAIIANIATIQEEEKGVFLVTYNFSTPRSQVWLPRQESNLD